MKKLTLTKIYSKKKVKIPFLFQWDIIFVNNVETGKST